MMAGAVDISDNSLKTLHAPSRVIRRQAFYYPAEDPQSPTVYILESKRARSLKIPLTPERPAARRYVWVPGMKRFGPVLIYFSAVTLPHNLAPQVEPLVFPADIPAPNSLASHYGMICSM